MRARWLWLGAAALYAVFTLWYVGWRGPLDAEEIATYLAHFEERAGADPQRLAVVREFLEADDGGEFFMLNLIRFPEDPVAMPGSGELRSGPEVLEPYTDFFMPRLLLRAGHPAFAGRGAGGYVDAWGVAPDPGWSVGAAIRYRSRRDMMELATHPGFEGVHEYKIAAMASTLAFPVAPGFVMLGPRVWVGLVLALLAALGQLAFGRPRGSG